MIINFKEIKLIPNIISTFRLLLLVPLIIIFEYVTNPFYRNNLLLILIFIAFLSDISDGFIARKFNQISELGKIIDPFADKILVAIFVFYFWKLNYLPTFYILIILLRDLLILIGGILISKKINNIVMSDYIGKLTVFSIGVFFIVILTIGDLNSIFYDILLYFTTIMIFVSFINYSIKSYKLIKK
ncbi:MAG: CDP-alcohol phosphatidyltransferase family protein [Melioribacteraceae bacterium]|nr:CDP-alcohol phosphatidyltransferase family protein [Melioribacteraceae bacterium]